MSALFTRQVHGPFDTVTDVKRIDRGPFYGITADWYLLAACRQETFDRWAGLWLVEVDEDKTTIAMGDPIEDLPFHLNETLWNLSGDLATAVART